jgi:hypothetical protein
MMRAKFRKDQDLMQLVGARRLWLNDQGRGELRDAASAIR